MYVAAEWATHRLTAAGRIVVGTPTAQAEDARRAAFAAARKARDMLLTIADRLAPPRRRPDTTIGARLLLCCCLRF